MNQGFFNDLSLKQYNRLQLNPLILQSMSVLCMNTAELNDYIDKLYQENPCIEKSEPEIPKEMLAVLSKYRSQDYSRSGAAAFGNEDASYDPFEPSQSSVDDYIDSLSYAVKSQIEKRRLEKALSSVCIYMADLLEENGWLREEALESLADLGVPEELISEAVKVIQSLEPAGIGARDLSDFLRLQLERHYPKETLAIRMTEEKCLNHLAKQQYHALAKLLQADISEVEKAAELIRSLNKEITVEYKAKNETVFTRPDVYIYVDADGRLKAQTNGYDTPVINVSQKYLEMYKTSDDPEVRKYLKDKIEETYRLISSMNRRESTLKRCTDYLISVQSDFLSGNSKRLQPLTMAKAAEVLEVNTSTISRCLMNKYIQSPAGVHPAKFFFSRALVSEDGSSRSAQEARQRIQELIDSENHARPLSDSAICEKLNAEGFAVKRRTVAKYRGELNIADYRLRKRK